ncbi:lipoprotein [Mycoplasma capricolum]|uniref:Lipoprotein n=1 Tax=Mycoplasma capricolum subsp. capricolum TaxID=40479 RepID=A0A0C2W7G6_MYCCA|nr:lipoprotein [Mycoplasma capricolum]KIM14212.1 lipoprotein [Mycoplasma capricolum subsp. capricolum]
MKKLLTLLGSVVLITTTSAAVIACGGTRNEQRTEDKNERKLVLTQKAKKEVSDLLKVTLSDTLDVSSENPIEIKEEVINDFANLLDEILKENNSNIDKSLEEFKEEVLGYVTDQLVGDLGSTLPKKDFENSELLDEMAFADEDDFVGIVFNKDPKMDIKPQDEEKTHKVVQELIKEYKDTVKTIKSEFEEETKEQFKKLKEIVEKDIKK